MCGKSKWMWVTSVMILSLLRVTYTGSLSGMKHITLHVQSEILDGHKIVITLEPQENDSGEDLQKKGKSAQAEEPVTTGSPEQDEDGDTGTDFAVKLEKSVTREVGENLANSSAPVMTNGTNTTVAPAPSKTTEMVIVSKVPSKEPGVQEFLVKFPDLKCPEGFRRDSQGKCRKLLLYSGGDSSRGKSFGGLNAMPRGLALAYPKKYYKRTVSE